MCQHGSVRLVALLPLLALSAFLAGCGASSPSSLPPPQAARAQSADLDWVETAGPPASRFVFEVHSFSVTAAGWTARVTVANHTDATFRVEGLNDPRGNAFGLMVFRTGSHTELEQRNRSIALPVLRQATRFAPALPSTLSPEESWTGTISAQGALPAGLWVRLVFGEFVPAGQMPDGLRRQGVRDELTWITDHTHRLE
jgi:hypothetical protein